MDNISISTHEKYGFLIVKPNDGYVITDWTEDKPIEEYSSTLIMYCAADADLSGYRTVSIDEDRVLSHDRDEAIAKAEEE